MQIDKCKKWKYLTETLGFGEYSNSVTGEMKLFSNLTDEQNKSVGFNDNGRIEFKSYEKFQNWFNENSDFFYSLEA
jgi:hypothetical protein